MQIKNVSRITNTIDVPYESMIYLQEVQHKQRCAGEYKPLSEKTKDRIKRHLPKSGVYFIHDGDLGGCIGNPANAWKEGRWTSWTVKEIKKMLDEADLPYGKQGTTEVIDVYF